MKPSYSQVKKAPKITKKNTYSTVLKSSEGKKPQTPKGKMC